MTTLLFCFVLFLYVLYVIQSKLIIARETGPYLVRYYIIPGNHYFNIYLHHFLSSDIDKALHDHPWASIGILIYGHYYEHMPVDTDAWRAHLSRETYFVKRRPFVPIYRKPEHIHKVELIDNKPVWTIFITGPVVRNWGFYCASYWRGHKDFLTEDGSNIGKGCD